MNHPSSVDRKFQDAIPLLYETHMVPMLFEPYAVDLASRVRVRNPSRILEVAAGTGAVTRALARATPASTTIVATDLNQAMLDRAAASGTSRPVEWRQADAMQLPFPDGAFDAVVCQFGMMFFPDKVKAFSEARRVLARGGVYIFSTWDRLSENEFADVVTQALEGVFPDDPPRFMERTPHGHYDTGVIARDLSNAGFANAPEIVAVDAVSRAVSARFVAIAYCQGSPWRNEIEARDAARLNEATDASEAALASRFGRGAVEGRMRAYVLTVGA